MPKNNKVKKEKTAGQNNDAKVYAVLGVLAVAAVIGYFVYQKFSYDPYKFGKVKASKHVERYLANDKRGAAEEITDAALYVAAVERERSPILIGDDDQKVLSAISEMYTQLGLADKADWTSAFKAYSPEGVVRPESAQIENGAGILTLGGGDKNVQDSLEIFGADVDLEAKFQESSDNADVLTRVAKSYLSRGNQARAKEIYDQVVVGMADQKDIFIIKRIFSEVVLGYIKAGEDEAAIDLYVKNNFFLGAGITLDMMREWTAQKDMDHAFYLFERMLYTPWQKAEALLILADGYRQTGMAHLEDDHERIINEVIEEAKEEPKKEQIEKKNEK